MTAWSASQYVKFEDERNRPAIELLARVRAVRPDYVVDIGCGPGTSTEILKARYPDAEVVGLDSSPDMLAAARERLPGVSFIEADVARWTPEKAPDVLFANATFQWVPRHIEVLRRLAGTLAPVGVLALQVPDNLAEPTHRLMHEVAVAGPWQAKFAAPIEREAIPAPDTYYDALKPIAGRVDIWSTAYNHVLADAGAIVEWVLGTGLRPYLARLDEAEKAAFLVCYRAAVAEAYPPRVDGTVLLRFPRLFIVASKD